MGRIKLGKLTKLLAFAQNGLQNDVRFVIIYFVEILSQVLSEYPYEIGGRNV